MQQRKTAGLIAALLTLTAAGWWFLRYKSEIEPQAYSVPKTSERQAGTVASSARNPQKGALPDFGTEAFKTAMLERCAAWLASRNRDATGLLAVWDLTGDEAMLKEAADKFPGNPQVCLAMLLHLGISKGPAEQRKLWIDRLISAVPENPLGYHHLAKWYAGQEDLASVSATLTTALSKTSHLDGYQRERASAVKEGLVAAGMALPDVCRLAVLSTVKIRGFNSPTTGMVDFFRQQFEKMKKAGNSEGRQDLAGLGLRVTEQAVLSESPSWTLEMQSSAQKMFF